MNIKCKKCGRETFSCSPVYEEIHCAECGSNDWILQKEDYLKC